MFDPTWIPEALKRERRWLSWRSEERGGKLTKVPLDPETGRIADATDPGIWLDFESAVERCRRRGHGLGFAVGGSGLVGVDLDDCLDAEGRLNGGAAEIVRRLDSYTEITPSGQGLRVWVRGTLPPGRRRKGPIELYDSGRYFTVTGWRLHGFPATIGERTAELAALHAELFPPTPAKPATPRPAPEPLDLTDRELLDRMLASAKGAEIRALFEGDTGRHPSRSEADLALCNHLAFWTGHDAAAIDRLFRQSGLCGDKWLSREDYRERTIAKAIADTPARDPHYHRKAQAQTAPPANPPPNEPPGGGGGNDGGTGEGGDFFHRTDLGNAKRLVARHGGSLRHCHPWQRWLVWLGDRWALDDTAEVFRKARTIITELHAEAATEPDDTIRKTKAAWALRCESESRLNAMVSLARHDPRIPILPDALDANPWALNCPNGTLDLRTGRFRAHDPTDLLSRRTEAPYRPGAEAPTWEAFLDRVMGGNAEMVGFLRRTAGYALTGDISEHALFFLYGRGRNGKSTFLNAVQQALGDYAITINADLITVKRGDDHPTGLADLQGRRFVATIEVEDGKRLAEALVKTLTGGDRIRARRMRQDFYEFDPTHKLFLAANHKPVIRGTDDGIWRRIKLIPFDVQIPTAEVDKTLPDRLRDEAPGILAWAVRGCREWLEHGLAPPAVVEDATSEYRSEMDDLAEFLGESCVLGAHYRAQISKLYHAYAEWCKQTGTYALSMRRFGLALTDRGLTASKVNGRNWRLGVGLRSEEEEEELAF